MPFTFQDTPQKNLRIYRFVFTQYDAMLCNAGVLINGYKIIIIKEATITLK